MAGQSHYCLQQESSVATADMRCTQCARSCPGAPNHRLLVYEHKMQGAMSAASWRHAPAISSSISRLSGACSSLRMRSAGAAALVVTSSSAAMAGPKNSCSDSSSARRSWLETLAKRCSPACHGTANAVSKVVLPEDVCLLGGDWQLGMMHKEPHQSGS